ncbi:MAG: hypothetical protein ACOYK6_07760 [Chthoniobacterales bacterium]
MSKNHPRQKKAIITVVTNDYFYQAVILGRTIDLFEQDTDFIVFVVGYKHDECCYQDCAFEIVDAKILNTEEWERFLFQYTGIAACCALKPRALKHTLLHYDKVIYLDSDMKLFKNLSEAWEKLDHADLSLTPHRNGATSFAAPLVSSMMLRISGIFNAGYIGATPSISPFLDWWWEKTHYNCLVDDFIIGIYLDQLYLHEALGRVDQLNILKHAGYNVAWWNFDQRKIERHHDHYIVNNLPLVLFHFSCFQFFLQNLKNFQWLQGRFGEIYFELYTNYMGERSYHKNRLSITTYPHDHFKDGTAISYDWREYIRRDIPELKEIHHPFDLSAEERKKIEEIMHKRPEFFQPNSTREVNDWRNSDLVYTRALSKSDSYIRFLEKTLQERGVAK